MIQKSFEDESKGKLYVVPTPIGNLEDITFRALNILKKADLIAAEDTRNTQKLLNHFDIHTSLLSYHEHNKREREESIVKKVREGQLVALVSDAGMPAISDPGHELVRAMTEADLSVIVLPGANAALCALVGSGLPSDEFYFYGFLPRKKKDKKDELARLSTIQATILVYESPFRIKETLKMIEEYFGNRKVAIARELTKRFEEYIRGTVDELISWTEDHEMRGEFCLVIEGSSEINMGSEEIWWSNLSIIEHVLYYTEEQSLPSKEAIKKVATDRKLPKREVYQAYHIDR